MTSFLKSTGAVEEQIAVVFLHRAQERLVGDGGSYHCKDGFKDLRQKPTKYPISSHANGPFVVEQASRRLKNNSPATRCLGHRTEVPVRGAMGFIQPVNEADEQGLAHTKVSKVVDFRRRSCRSGISLDKEGLNPAGETPALLFRSPKKIRFGYHMRYKEGVLHSIRERLFLAAVRFLPSVPILEKSKARQGSRRANKKPRMANAMN
jgi:hypothetical protein